MWWPFKRENQNYEEMLNGLLKSQELLNERFEKKQMSNETYLKKAEELRKKIDKCKRQIEKGQR